MSSEDVSKIYRRRTDRTKERQKKLQMTTRKTWKGGRRTVLKAIAGGIVFASTVDVASADDVLAKQLNTVRDATQKYRDVKLARAEGYDEISPYVPGMGFHFENHSLIAADENEEPDLTQPATLVYQTTGNYDPDPSELHDSVHDDDLRLGAAEFIHDGTPGADADYFDDESAKREVRTAEADGWTVIPKTGHTGLHAWVHRGNPDGVFAPLNPTVE